MATENKEKAKGEAIFPLTQEQINQIAAIGAKEGVRAYKEEQKKEERRRKKEDSKVRKTKKLLSSYRRIKATLSDGEQFTPEEQAELRWKFVEDLMGNTREIAGKSERTIKDTERNCSCEKPSSRRALYFLYACPLSTFLGYASHNSSKSVV